jgi:hypothetical protein
MRRIDNSITSCFVYTTDGLKAKPPQTHITRADKARANAEARMLLKAGMNGSDLVTYYRQLLGPNSYVPQHDLYRISDRNGSKKSCMPSST